MTLNGLDNGLDDRLNGLLNQDWPDDALMQCGLVSSPDLLQTIEQLLALQGHVDSAFAAMLEQNIRQLQAGVHQPMTNGPEVTTGDFMDDCESPGAAIVSQ